MDDLYRARLMFDLHRQPAYGVFLLEFDSLLNSLSESHPYSLSRDKIIQFSNVLQGSRPGSLPGDLLFRLTSLNRLLERDGIRRLKTANKDELFQEAQEEFERQRIPIPLTWAAEGRLGGLRRIDFWTDMDLRIGDLERNSYQIGLPRNWFPVEDPIVLLCPSRLFEGDNCKLRVPTVLDGYDFAPFFATLEADRLGRGHALDLQDPANLKLGAAEFVGSEVPVDALKFVPMKWSSGRPTPSRERSLQANSSLIERLVEFLQKGA